MGGLLKASILLPKRRYLKSPCVTDARWTSSAVDSHRQRSKRRPHALKTVFTIGHSTLPITEFVALLGEVEADVLVDVRSIPRSRTNPQFNADVLRQALNKAGIAYRHLPALGGLRRPPRGATPSSNTFWRVAAFRNYADYAATAAFRKGMIELQELARDHSCAIMCAEAVWWRCHRRIISDYLLIAGRPVVHIMGHNKAVLATITPGVRVLPNGVLVYSAAQKKVKAIAESAPADGGRLVQGGHTRRMC